MNKASPHKDDTVVHRLRVDLVDAGFRTNASCGGLWAALSDDDDELLEHASLETLS